MRSQKTCDAAGKKKWVPSRKSTPYPWPQHVWYQNLSFFFKSQLQRSAYKEKLTDLSTEVADTEIALHLELFKYVSQVLSKNQIIFECEFSQRSWQLAFFRIEHGFIISWVPSTTYHERYGKLKEPDWLWYRVQFEKMQVVKLKIHLIFTQNLWYIYEQFPV